MIIIDQADTATHIYTPTSWTKKSYHHSIEKTYKEIRHFLYTHKRTHMHMLIDEIQFAFHTIDIAHTSKMPLRIQELQHLIDQKIHTIAAQDRCVYRVIGHSISQTFVDEKPTKHIVWKVWILRFRLHLFLLKPHMEHICALSTPEKITENNFRHIVPRSKYTLDYIAQKTHKNNYLLLSIQQNMTQLICVRNNRWHDIHYINMGETMLKSCYKDHHISKYYYTPNKHIIENAFLQKSIHEAIWFFTRTLGSWIMDHLPQDDIDIHDILIIWNCIDNSAFVDFFTTILTTNKKYFILPLHIPRTSSCYTYSPAEIHVATCIQAKTP